MEPGTNETKSGKIGYNQHTDERSVYVPKQKTSKRAANGWFLCSMRYIAFASESWSGKSSAARKINIGKSVITPGKLFLYDGNIQNVRAKEDGGMHQNLTNGCGQIFGRCLQML